jgi:hypothetical protein
MRSELAERQARDADVHERTQTELAAATDRDGCTCECFGEENTGGMNCYL